MLSQASSGLRSYVWDIQDRALNPWSPPRLRCPRMVETLGLGSTAAGKLRESKVGKSASMISDRHMKRKPSDGWCLEDHVGPVFKFSYKCNIHNGVTRITVKYIIITTFSRHRCHQYVAAVSAVFGTLSSLGFDYHTCNALSLLDERSLSQNFKSVHKVDAFD